LSFVEAYRNNVLLAHHAMEEKKTISDCHALELSIAGPNAIAGGEL